VSRAGEIVSAQRIYQADVDPRKEADGSGRHHQRRPRFRLHEADDELGVAERRRDKPRRLSAFRPSRPGAALSAKRDQDIRNRRRSCGASAHLRRPTTTNFVGQGRRLRAGRGASPLARNRVECVVNVPDEGGTDWLDVAERKEPRHERQTTGNRRRGEQWVWLTRGQLQSAGWQGLGINARRLIDFLMLEHMSHGLSSGTASSWRHGISSWRSAIG